VKLSIAMEYVDPAPTGAPSIGKSIMTHDKTDQRG
jgi:hypothetical protein